MIDWSWVSRLSWVVGFIVGLTLILHIGNIARIGISNVVGDNLSAAIRKGNMVLPSCGIAISVLILGKVGTRVVISNSIAILVDSWLIIGWLMVRSWLVDRGWVIRSWGWGVIGSWGWVSDDWNGMNDWSSMDDWSNTDNWSGVVDGGDVDSWDVVDGGMDKSWSMVWLMNSMAHNWSMSMLDGCVAGHISGHSGEESRDSNKSL